MSKAQAQEPAPDTPEAYMKAMEGHLPSWEDDETVAAPLLRSLFILLAGGYLAWAQWHAPILPAQQWGRWVGTSVVLNFIIPMGLVCFFLAQTPVYIHWLKDQRSNAWSYGWSFGKSSCHLKLALWAWLPLLPFLLYFGTRQHIVAGYAGYLPVPQNPGAWLFLLASTVVYMFCWEWFFRGFMLFGLAQGLGAFLAIVLQAGLFALTHIGKPAVEVWGSLLGGLILGIVCWREKSFAPAFYAHAFIHLTWTIIVVWSLSR